MNHLNSPLASEMSNPIYDNNPFEEKQMEDITFNKTGESDEAEVREVDIYESSDMYGGLRAETQSPVHQQPAGSTSARTSLRAVIVCLALLCALLLAAVIGTALHCRIKLQTLNESFAEERKQTMDEFCKIKPPTHNKSCTKERNETWIEVNEFCKDGCRYFNNSFYYISSNEKSWNDSRQDCKVRGADLVIVNSEEEQSFISFFKSKFWIGLNDREKNGTWKWVDGSVLNNTGFWADRQPSWTHEGRQENCVEFEGGNWNDAECATTNFWICEKVTGFQRFHPK